ncbi:MAG TPA: hypothetical protein VFC19_17570 [Candidatus Limnocylindrales bacterium]|nr:hypothetical protein [Candidatus Limnocylindrales bacterium]
MRKLTIAVCCVALMAGLALAGCSSPPAGDGVATAGSGAPAVAPAPADRRAWAQCMRRNGVDVPDEGKYDPGRFDKKQVAPAEQACRQFLPPADRIRPMDAAEVELWRRWAQCMREHGIDVEDPDPNGPPPGPRSTDIPMDQVLRAEEACQASQPPTRGAN